MKTTSKTSPITGLTFRVFELDDGTLLADHALKHRIVPLVYDKDHDAYLVKREDLEPIETIGLAAAAEYLGVSRMRISRMCASGQLVSCKANGVLVIDFESVKAYRKDAE